MFSLLLAWSAAPAAACSGSMAYSLTTAGLLPIDARAVVTGQYAASITVSDEDGHDVPGVVTEECSDGNSVVTWFCRYMFAPTEPWVPGVSYQITVVTDVYTTYDPESSFRLSIGEGTITPVVGTPALTIQRVPETDTGWSGNSCSHGREVSYDLHVTPAPDPYGISYVRIERRDGRVRLRELARDGAPFDWTIRAPGPDSPADDCMRITQVDGAGNESSVSDWVCVAAGEGQGEGEAETCGCAVAPGWGAGVALALVALPLLARRRS